MLYHEIGAITLLDSNITNNELKVNAMILTNKIHKIYDTTRQIANDMNLDVEKEEENELTEEELERKEIESLLNQQENTTIENEKTRIKYNTQLLKYACVFEAGTDFAKTLFIVRRNCDRNNNNIFNSCNIYCIQNDISRKNKRIWNVIFNWNE